MKLFREWFSNVPNASSALAADDATKDADRLYPFFSLNEKSELNAKIRNLEFRIKCLRRGITYLARDRKAVTFGDFDEQLYQVLQAREALAHQNMLASQNKAVTEILKRNLAEEIAKIKFLVFEDLNEDADVAEAKFEDYFKKAEQDIVKVEE